MNTSSANNRLHTDGLPEVFAGFPYLATRIVPGLHHILPLPKYDFVRVYEMARSQAGRNKLPTCLVISRRRCLFVGPAGTERASSEVPAAPYVEWGKLLPCEALPELAELLARREELQRFSDRLKSHLNEGQGFLLGDLTKGGRPPQPREEHLLRGVQEGGVPKGLVRCPTCWEWRGECIDPVSGLVVRVHCKCQNDNLCAACIAPLYHRKLNANFYSESDGRIWHVPAFVAFDHKCSRADEAHQAQEGKGEVQ